jgi:parallel beta-helix repeat protein
MDTARVMIADTTVNASGQRFPATTPAPSGPGAGIRFEGMAAGTIARSIISGNTATGISSGSARSIVLQNNSLFDNGRNFGVSRTRPSSEKAFITVDNLEEIEVDTEDDVK